MTITNPFLRSLSLLQSHNCEYCAIGGFAVVMYGIQRFTPDVNIVISESPQNIVSLMQAMSSANFEVMGGGSLQDTEVLLKKQVGSRDSVGNVAFLDPQAPGFQLQVMWGLPLSFDEISKNRQTMNESGIDFYVSSVESLAQLKAKSSRAQDVYEAGVLVALHNLQIEVPGLDSLDAEDSIKQDLENFAGFRDEPVASKLEWLQLVLTQLGSFCVV